MVDNETITEEEIKPANLAIGNFVDNMGTPVIVFGITHMGNSRWYVETHSYGEDQTERMPNGIVYRLYPIRLTKEWKECLGIDKFELPPWIKYVHQVQNYFNFSLRVEIHELIDYNKIPK